MKPLLLLFLTISLGSPLTSYANARYTAPSSDQSITGDRTTTQMVDEDSVSTGQSATRRDNRNTMKDYDSDRNYRMCKDANGSWLRPGDMGYTTCMNDPSMLRK